MIEIRKCVDPEAVMRYIGSYWKAGHILSRSREMFDFQYLRDGEYSIQCAYNGTEMVGFIGAIVAEWPEPSSYWLALWHTLESCRGTGVGGRLLQAMEDAAPSWIGTYGAGPKAVPVYLKRGYEVCSIRRWVPTSPIADFSRLGRRTSSSWVDFRFTRHPVFSYEMSGGLIYRRNADWTHIVGSTDLVSSDIVSGDIGQNVDCWSATEPGNGWVLCDPSVPSVFHPPEARGNTTIAVGKPYVPLWIMKGDCDQDRPS